MAGEIPGGQGGQMARLVMGRIKFYPIGELYNRWSIRGLACPASLLFSRRFSATCSVRVSCEAPGEITAGLRFALFT
jgi:hypothetical protein